MIKRFINYFTFTEKLLWLCSVAAIITVFVLFDRESILSLAASLIGVTSLIFSAKGNPAGLVLMIIFSILYGIIPFSFAYYGEMITYLCMTMPMSAFALICWLKNPYGNNRTEVKISSIKKSDLIILCVSAIAVTVAFYFILAAFNTANIIPSTISVTTSYAAVFLTAKRSPFFALAYAFNDMVLIILWIMATTENVRYASVAVCFVIFLINDLYGFINWNRMKKNQAQ